MDSLNVAGKKACTQEINMNIKPSFRKLSLNNILRNASLHLSGPVTIWAFLDIKSISLLGLYQQKLFAVEFFPNNYEENISFDSDDFCDFAYVMR